MTEEAIRPLGNKLFVRRDEKETTSTGGIVLSENTAGKQNRGTVIFAGPGKTLENGTLREIAVKPGDRILFGKFTGTEIKINDEELLVIADDDVIAIIEE